MPSYLALLFLLFCAAGRLAAQPPVDRGNLYQRVHAVVPIIGKGTYDDPRRPMYAPAPGSPIDKGGILSYTFQESEDGRFALVEFVALDRAAFRGILAETRPDVKVFEKGKARREDIDREFRRLKANIDLSRFGGRLP